MARAYIEYRQDPDGAFTDPNLTAEVILALSERGLGYIRNLDCGKYDSDFDNHGEIINNIAILKTKKILNNRKSE